MNIVEMIIDHFSYTYIDPLFFHPRSLFSPKLTNKNIWQKIKYKYKTHVKKYEQLCERQKNTVILLNNKEWCGDSHISHAMLGLWH